MEASISPLAPGPEPGELELRSLTTPAEFGLAVELQRLTWGASFREVVPAAILQITQRLGGVVAGAFSADGTLCGFVYGLTGLYRGGIAHWSHMLAVRPDLRNHGIGRRLKAFQRELLLAAGVERMYWTFDPLVARNAHLNLNHLGVEVCEYVSDMYGDTGSSLHAFGTDRFIVSWPVREQAKGRPPAAVADRRSVLIDIPADVESLSVAEAREWRERSRQAFQAALSAGYRVAGFQRAVRRCYYILSPE